MNGQAQAAVNVQGLLADLDTSARWAEQRAECLRRIGPGTGQSKGRAAHAHAEFAARVRNTTAHGLHDA